MIIKDRGGLPALRPLKVFLRQEADCGIVVRDSSVPERRRYVAVPLPAMPSDDDQDRGVRLQTGVVQTLQWETRPLRGTYTVQLGHALSDFPDSEHFHIEIHFVAIGRP